MYIYVLYLSCSQGGCRLKGKTHGAERQRLDLLLELQEFTLVSGVVKEARGLTVEPIREVKRSTKRFRFSNLCECEECKK